VTRTVIAARRAGIGAALALCAAASAAQPNPVQPELPYPSDAAPALSGMGLRPSAGWNTVVQTSSRVAPRVSLLGVDESAPPPAPAPVIRLAQFQLPQAGSREGSGPSRQKAEELAKDLDYQYSWGSDTELIVERNNDLRNTGKGDATRPARDNLRLLNPTVFVLGRTEILPWVDLNLGATFEQQLRLHEEEMTILPDGTRDPSVRRAFTAKLDVANIVIKNISDHPLEITLGRRTFEDPRLWLYDVTLDGVHVRYRGENYNTELSVTREDNWDMSVFLDFPKSTIRNYILYHDYRGIEDHRIAAYAIARLDRLPRSEGRFKLYGLRAYGRPMDEFNYWSEMSWVRGIDEARVPLPLHGTAYDVGLTYRFPTVALSPCLTVANAYGSGDAVANDGVNREYRQTGMQSNETKFCGVAQFKRYGEFIDPELSNLRIYTFGFGFRPSANIYVDLVHHQYRLNHNATDVRNGLITAQMNTRLAGSGRNSKDVGRELDLIVAFRRILETKWAVDLRFGYFFPGNAYLRNDGGNNPASTTNPPRFANPDRGLRILGVFSY
jgi:alginate production protein